MTSRATKPFFRLAGFAPVIALGLAGAHLVDCRASCPSAAFVEEVHAAALYFQRGDSVSARPHLERARELDFGNDPVAGQVMAFLGRAALESDPSTALVEAEKVRDLLGYWECLPKEFHDELHTRLPPINS